MNNIDTSKVKHYDGYGTILPIRLREKEAKRREKASAKEAAMQKTMNAWRDDPRMVFLANPGRDLTKAEREEWERSITQYQIYGGTYTE